MLFEEALRKAAFEAVQSIYGPVTDPTALVFNPTRKEFTGDITLVVFPIAKAARVSPDQAGNAIGEWLLQHSNLVSAFNSVKGFLNISIRESEWLNAFLKPAQYVFEADQKSGPVLVEYSSPNTNKPIHLGHVRNNLLGYSVSCLLQAAGKKVVKVNLVNDRGIHICKSMLAWMKSGEGKTPADTGEKGDHMVGRFYVEFDKIYKKETAELVAAGMDPKEAEKKAPSMLEAQELLRQWENGDEKVVSVWKMMNGWVYEGFDETYRMLGVDFDRMYYESETYLLGKAIVQEGLEKKVFYKKEDGSVWIDLRDEGLDEKLLLRSDGTSVYITQDIGTAVSRYNEYKFSRVIHVVGNEQEYHFKVLRLILKKMGYDWWDKVYHLSYGMVDLPSGKMKSREGTVVDADDLMHEMITEAEKITRELGKTGDLQGEEAAQLFRMIGLGALKYFILKVDPEKRMLFNPEESIDFNGHTGPFIQYTHARIRSVLRKAESMEVLKRSVSEMPLPEKLEEKEKQLMILLLNYRDTIKESSERFSPAVVANYAYELAKQFNQFYHDYVIADAASPQTSKWRLLLSERTADAIASSMNLLGIAVPERM